MAFATMRAMASTLGALILLVLATSSVANAEDYWAEWHKRFDWPMYGRDLHHTFSNPHSLINPGNVASLKRLWDFPTGDAVSASPAVVNGVVYVGSWDGYFYAIKVTDGSLLWKFQVDCQNTVIPIPPQCLAPGETSPPRYFTSGGLITSSAAVTKDHVFFAAGRTVYSLNTRDGSLRWKTPICGNPDVPNCLADKLDPNQVFSSPAILDDKLFVGHSVDGNIGYRGGIEALDVDTGKILWRFEVDPILKGAQPLTDYRGRAEGGYNRGCGNVWSSAAVDEASRLVFFGTADCNNQPLRPYHGAVLALDADTGALRWVYRPEKPNTCDYDFGASPNVIDLRAGRYLGIGGKDGTYYVLQPRTRNSGGELLEAFNVVFGGTGGGFIGSTAFAGTRVFGATAIGDGGFDGSGRCEPNNPRDLPVQEPSMHAFDLVQGQVAWQQQNNHSAAASTVTNGVVFSGLIGIEPFAVNAYDAASGALLASFPAAGSVNSAAVPVGEMLFFGTGTSTDGSGSGVHALTLP